VAVVAAVGLGLTGCSDPGTPSDTLPTAASTSAEPTLEPLGPADFPVPPEAREQTEDGAVAAAKYYLELSFRTTQTLDTTWLQRLSQDCENCAADVTSYDQDRAAGTRYEGGDATVAAFLDESIDGGAVSVGVAVQRAAFRAVGPDGQVLVGRDVAAQQLSGGLTLSWDPIQDAWLTTSLYLERSQ